MQAVGRTPSNGSRFAPVCGRPIVGIEQASRYYFGRTAGELSLLESALLAGMVQAPSSLDYLEHRDAAMSRAEAVRQAMVRFGYITVSA